MKKITVLFFALCLALPAFGQGVAIRSLNGQSTNLTAYSASSNAPALTVKRTGVVVVEGTNSTVGTHSDYAAIIIGTNASSGGAGGEIAVPNNFRLWDKAGNYFWMMPTHGNSGTGGPTMALISGTGGLVFNPGQGGNLQFGNSGATHNQTFTIQYNDETLGWSHLMRFRARTNASLFGDAAVQARLTNGNLVELHWYTKAPTWNPALSSGFSDAGIPSLIFRTNGVDVLSGYFFGSGEKLTGILSGNISTTLTNKTFRSTLAGGTTSGLVWQNAVEPTAEFSYDAGLLGYNFSGALRASGGFIGNGLSLTNLPITGLQGSGGAGTAASNGTAGLKLTSAGNGGVYWTADDAGGGAGTFNANQFDNNASVTNIKSGAIVTNLTVDLLGGGNLTIRDAITGGSVTNLHTLGHSNSFLTGIIRLTGNANGGLQPALEIGNSGFVFSNNIVTAPNGITCRSNVVFLTPTNATTGLVVSTGVEGNKIHAAVTQDPTVNSINTTTLTASGGMYPGITNRYLTTDANGKVVATSDGSGFTNLVTSRLVPGSNITFTTNSPNTVNETVTIASTGGAGSVTNTDIVYNYGIKLEDHFIYGNVNASAYLGNFFFLANSGSASMENPPLDTTHQGILTLVTLTSASAAPIAYTGLGACLLGSKPLDVEYIWRIPTASDNTENFQIRIGNHDSNSSTEPADGVFFRYSNNTNGGSLEFVARANNVESVTNTALAVATGVWYTNRITTDAGATLATIYTNGVVAATLSSNIPSVASALARATGLGSFQIIKAAGTTSRTLYCDYWKVKH